MFIKGLRLISLKAYLYFPHLQVYTGLRFGMCGIKIVICPCPRGYALTPQ